MYVKRFLYLSYKIQAVKEISIFFDVLNTLFKFNKI